MRTLDDIVPPSRRSSPIDAPIPVSSPPERSRGRFPAGTLLAIIIIIGASAGTLSYFSSASVLITPLTKVATLSSTALTATVASSELNFEVITVEKIESQSVTSTGTKAVSAPAGGSITIYNAVSTAQKLIPNTRFQATGGQMYKIGPSVVVPAAKAGVPGSVTVTVTAAQPGSSYNIGPSSFTLPGLSGSPLFTQITAKSTIAMSGGASGNEPTVASETESATRSALMDTLAKDLDVSLAAKVPKGYVLLAGSRETNYAPLPTTAGETSGTASLKHQGTMRAVVLPAGAVAKAIATASLGTEYKGEAVTLEDTTGLTLRPTTALPSSGDLSFAFTLSGTATLVSVVDQPRISAAIAGKTRAEASSILKQYPEIQEAVLILRPFWRSSFPEDPSKITVQVGGTASI